MKLRAALFCLTTVTFLGASSFASPVGSSAHTYPSAAGHHGVYHPTTPKDSVLYSNGADDGINAYTINSGYSVTNSFDLSAPNTATSVTFSNWFFPGDTGSSVDWAITTAPFGGTTEASGTASLTGTLVGQGLGFFDIYSETFSLGSVSLAAGTYYLQLGNEVVSFGDPGYWGESAGPSFACQSGNGLDCLGIPSESFSISGGSAPPPIPEPSSLVLFGTGLLGAAGALRRKFSV